MTRTRAVIYTRLSKDDNDDQLGVTRQRTRCRELADQLGWTVVGEYSDNDKSAYNGKPRPDFERMLTAMAAREFDAVVVWHPDRLHRGLPDLVRLFAAGPGIEVRSVNAGAQDLGTASGRMMAAMLGTVSGFESEHHAERRREANAQRRAAGKWNREGYTPFAYTRDGELVHDQANALRQAATDVLNGKSLRAITIEWNTRGLLTNLGKQWTNLRLRRVLLNPTYAGLVSYGGKNEAKQILDGVTGQWQALWDKDTHYALRDLLTDENRRPSSAVNAVTGRPSWAFVRSHMLSGVAVCGRCGAKLYCQPHRDRASTYVCRAHAHLGRLADPLDTYVESVVLALLRRSDIHKRLTATEDIDVDALRAKRKGLSAQKDKLATLLIEGVLSETGVRKESAKLSEQIDGITRALADAVRSSPAAAMLADGVDKLTEHWEAASPDIRSKVVDELMVVTVLPVPKGQKGTVVDLATGEKIVNDDYVQITPK
jgi:DNA invertase Pin-like site-specific DNA recombinase